MGPRSPAGGRPDQSFSRSRAPGVVERGRPETTKRARGGCSVHNRGAKPMSWSRCLLLLAFGAIAAVASACSRGGELDPPREEDAAASRGLGRLADAARGDSSVTPVRSDARIDDPADAAGPGGLDARGGDRGGRDAADASVADAAGMPRMCMAGHTCDGNARCQRSCFGGLVYRCSCAEGRFICTGCISVDAGTPDARMLASCGASSVQGRRCDRSGAVCQYRSDGGERLCVCGDVGQDRFWVCQ
jgi:hypothetical protein